MSRRENDSDSSESSDTEATRQAVRVTDAEAEEQEARLSREAALRLAYEFNELKNVTDEEVWNNRLIEHGLDWRLFQDAQNKVNFKEYTTVMGASVKVFEKRFGSFEHRHMQLLRQVTGSSVTEETTEAQTRAMDPAALERRRQAALNRMKKRGTVFRGNDLQKIELSRDYEDFVDPIIGQFKDTFHTEGFQTFLSYAMVPDNAGRLSFEEKFEARPTLVGNKYKRIDIDSFDFSSLDQRSVCPRISVLKSSIEHPFGLEPEQMRQALSQAQEEMGDTAAYNFGNLAEVDLPPAGDGYVYELDFGAPSDMRPGDISLDPEVNRSLHSAYNTSAHSKAHDDFDYDQPEDDDGGDGGAGEIHQSFGNTSMAGAIPTNEVQLDNVLERMSRMQDPMPRYKRLTEEHRERTDHRPKRRKKERTVLDLRSASKVQFKASSGGFLKDRDRIPKQNMGLTVLLDVKFFNLNTLETQPQCMQAASAERFSANRTSQGPGASYNRGHSGGRTDNYESIFDDHEIEQPDDDGGHEDIHEMHSMIQNQMNEDDYTQSQGFSRRTAFQPDSDPEVRGIFIRRKIDQNTLKTRIIKNIEQGSTTLKALSETTCSQYTEQDLPSLTRHTFFLSMLFVANEHGLDLKSSGDFHDVEIRLRPDAIPSQR